MSEVVRLFIEPWDRKERPPKPDGRQMYRVIYAGSTLIESTPEPLFDSCRALLAEGITGKAEMWAKGEQHPRMIADIEKGTPLTVAESNRLGPRIVKYRRRPDMLSKVDERQTRRRKAPSRAVVPDQPETGP